MLKAKDVVEIAWNMSDSFHPFFSFYPIIRKVAGSKFGTVDGLRFYCHIKLNQNFGDGERRMRDLMVAVNNLIVSDVWAGTPYLILQMVEHHSVKLT